MPRLSTSEICSLPFAAEIGAAGGQGLAIIFGSWWLPSSTSPCCSGRTRIIEPNTRSGRRDEYHERPLVRSPEKDPGAQRACNLLRRDSS